MFHLMFQHRFGQFEKVPNFVVNEALSCLIRSNMHAVSVCFCNPLNYKTHYRIFKVSTQAFNACMFTCVYRFLFVSCCFCKTEWLPFSWQGLWAPFFIW